MKRLLIGGIMTLLGLAIVLYHSSYFISCSSTWLTFQAYPNLGIWFLVGIALCFAGTLLAISGGGSDGKPEKKV